MRRLFVAFVIAQALAPACKSKDNTKIVVGVWSDLAEIESIRIDVTGTSDVGSKTFQLVAGGQEGKSALPILLDLVPLGDKNAAFTVTALAFKGTTQLVSQTVRAAFVKGEARLLKLLLSRACEGKVCTGDTTCSAGVCGAVPQPILPTYDPKAPLLKPDAGVSGDSGVSGDGGETDARGVDGKPSEVIASDARKPDGGATEDPDAPVGTGGSGGSSGLGGAGGNTGTGGAGGIIAIDARPVDGVVADAPMGSGGASSTGGMGGGAGGAGGTTRTGGSSAGGLTALGGASSAVSSGGASGAVAGASASGGLSAAGGTSASGGVSAIGGATGGATGGTTAASSIMETCIFGTGRFGNCKFGP